MARVCLPRAVPGLIGVWAAFTAGGARSDMGGATRRYRLGHLPRRVGRGVWRGDNIPFFVPSHHFVHLSSGGGMGSPRGQRLFHWLDGPVGLGGPSPSVT